MIKSQILSNASRIRRYLDQKGEASIREIRIQFKLPEQEVCLALGWLANDNKIILHQTEEEIIAINFES